MEELPVILTIAVQHGKTEDLIKLILEKDDISGVQVNEDVTSYVWTIDNKYYTANVNLYSLNSINFYKNNLKSVEAVVFYYDCISENFQDVLIDQLNEWISYVKNNNISVKILVFNNSTEKEIRKDTVEQWCIKNNFELVEIEQKQKDEQICVEFAENTGIKRVIEILHTHHWPNFVLKGHRHISNNINNFKAVDVDVNRANNKTHSAKDNKINNTNNSSNELQDNFEDELDDIDQLTTFYGNLKCFKRDFSALSDQERFSQAEKIVKAFWNAIHGDSDEFSESEDETK
ncbi:hypothetical protein PGB90_005864 [Kerria lacca]